MKTTNFQLCVNHKQNASIDLTKSINTNVKSIIDASTAKKDRKAVIDNSNAERFSLSETVKILQKQCTTETGANMLNSNFLTIEFFNLKNILKCLSGFTDANNQKTLCTIIKKTDKNGYFNTKTVDGFKLSLSIVDNGFLSKIDDNGFLILIDKNSIEYTLKIVENFSFSFIVEKLAKFKKQLLINKMQIIRDANIDKITLEKEKEKAEKAAKAKAEKEKEKAEAETKAEAEKAEAEAEILRLKNIEKMYLEMQNKKATKAEKLQNVA